MPTLGIIKTCKLWQHRSWDLRPSCVPPHLSVQLAAFLGVFASEKMHLYILPSFRKQKSRVAMEGPSSVWCVASNGQHTAAFSASLRLVSQRTMLQCYCLWQGDTQTAWGHTDKQMAQGFGRLTWSADGEGLTEVLCSFQDIDASRLHPTAQWTHFQSR